MTSKTIMLFLGAFLILPIMISSAHAENSWTVFLTPYDGIEKEELFRPLEIPIHSGDKVTWINQDSTTHKIVSGVPQHPDYSGEFFSTDILSPGESYSVSLDFEGFVAYYYFCEIHPWFTGKIFFEDRPDIFHSTLDISYEINDSEILLVNGLVESDLGTTGYEILIYDSKNNLIFQKVDSFELDATFDVSIDISSSVWDHDENYVLKLVYGIPSESTILSLEIPIYDVDDELKSKSLEFCQDSESTSNFLFEGNYLPNWYKKLFCWFGNGLVVEKEIYDSIDFFQKNYQR